MVYCPYDSDGDGDAKVYPKGSGFFKTKTNQMSYMD